MIHQTAKWLFTGALATACLTLSAAAQTNAPKAADKLAEFFGDPVVARGKGLEIKASQIEDYVVSYKAAAAASGEQISAQQLKLVKRRILDELIGQRLVLAKATDADKKKGKDEVDAALRRIKDEKKVTDAEFDEKLALQLRAQQMTRAQWDQRQIDQAVYLAVLEREMKINITDDQMKKWYDEHPQQFEEPERVRVSHILLSTKDPADTNPNPALRRELSEDQKQVKLKKLEEIQKRARAGEDFTKLAKEFSEDPGVKINNGEYIMARGDSFVPEFKNAAFSLSSNQVSEVVTTVFGYHIIKLLEKIPAQKIELAKVRDRLLLALKQQEIAKQLSDYLEGLQKAANVEILDADLKAVDMDIFKAPRTNAPPIREGQK